MKPKVFKNILLPLAILLLGIQVQAKSVDTRTEYTKSYAKEFDVNKSDKFKVENRYGKVDIKTWGESRVKVDVLVTVNARSKEAADEMLDRINIIFDQGAGITSAITEIADKKSSWSSWWSGGSGDDFKIDYTIKIPKEHSLDLSNKYGHSYLTDIDGSADFSIKYGDLYAQNVGKAVSIFLGYGTANLGNLKSVDGNVKYGKFNMENSGDIKMECKYSKLTFGEVGNMDIISGYDNIDIISAGDVNFSGKYGDLDIGNSKRVNVESKYTSVGIQNCAGGGRFNLSYGGLRIDELGPDFGSLEVEGSYSGIKVHVHPSASFTLDAKARYAGIKYPDNLDIRRDVKQSNTHEISGQLGSGSGKINIDSNYGSISVW